MNYSTLCNQFILPAVDFFTGRKIKHYQNFLSEAQWWTPSKLHRYQFIKLKSTLKFAYQSTPYYQRIFDSLNFNPNHLDSIDDLSQIPILTKDIIQNQGIENFLENQSPLNLIKESTSGSTGKQGVFFFSKLAQSFTYAAQLQFFNWAGYTLGDPILQTGMSFPRGFEKSIKDILYRCAYVSAFNLSDKDLEHAYQLLVAKKLSFIIGYASSLYCLAEYLSQRGLKLPLKGVISLGDMLFPHYRALLESVFNCKITDTYGSCEGFMVAGQCEFQHYHVSIPLNIVEIVDNQGNKVPDGETGRVLLTRLDNNPMPLIRYDIGDLAVMAKSQSCLCNRGYQILEKIIGRDTDIVVTPNGYKLIVHFFTAIFEHEPTIQEFRVIQKDISSICILIVPRTGFHNDILAKLGRLIREKCNNDINVNFDIVDQIPLTKSGKRRFVISDFSLK